MTAVHGVRCSSALLAAFVALALVAAGCSGSEDDAGAATDGDEAGLVDDGADGSAAAPEASTTTTGEPMRDRGDLTLADFEAEWAEARAAVVASIVEGGYGVGDDNVLRGPEGFEVDLNECPADWSDTAGLDDETITIGHTNALTGPLAGRGDFAIGMGAYFDHVNEGGGIDGRELELITKDDGYLEPSTIQLVDEFLEMEQPFLITTHGSPNTLATYGTVNAACVPQPFVMADHSAWGDPQDHPWTTGLEMAPATEAVFWGNWIAENLVEELPVTVGALVLDDSDLGLEYRQGFEDWAAANPDVVEEFVAVPHAPSATSVAEEVTAIAAAEPDVFIMMTTNVACTLAMQDAAGSGLAASADALFTSSVCRSPEFQMIPAGDAADGYLVVAGGAVAFDDPEYADDAFVAFVNAEIEAAGLDAANVRYALGFAQYGWAHVEALRIAAELPGGLSRTNLLLALRALDLRHPAFVDGIRFAAVGNDDGYFVEGSAVSRYDAQTQSWTRLGPAVDLNGETPNCRWVDETGC